MDSEYDQKFEEMKKYIPFLENMITRLESTNTTSSNPRQAQLDKIRSLRDLLSNKKKRMKMENLLKCEQVLINLHAKVEQRDTLSGGKKLTGDSSFSIDTPTPKEKSDLEAVRNKLKTVVKLQENVQDTLPEILPRSEVNDVHTSGTKEPALFQRRPNLNPSQINQPNTETKEIKASPPGSATKRNYTRVLVSPESSARRWSPSASKEKPLFSRRSPRKSPRRNSPSYKKERKKTKNSQSRNHKKFDITLNVPDASLDSLNTKDILSRIINCSDSDVDITTLRELRQQILGELQKTGARDDISDLILKSYNKKSEPHKKTEIEEGELSDSESEAIESIYGSLVVKEPGSSKVSEKEAQPRKIQICLVINSDDKSTPKLNDMPKQNVNADFDELEMFENEKKKDKTVSEDTIYDKLVTATKTTDEKYKQSDQAKMNNDKTMTNENQKDNSYDLVDKKMTPNLQSSVEENVLTSLKDSSATTEIVTTSSNQVMASECTPFKANFYKPLADHSSTKSVKSTETSICSKIDTNTKVQNPIDLLDIASKLEQIQGSQEIPLLHERTIEKKPPETTLSEIDILQALKKEILSEISVPGTETTTPLLHQPKVNKVVSAQEILPKKRISIENYKKKSATSSNLPTDHLISGKDDQTPSDYQISGKDDQTKKPSLKLTDKECERFFNIPKIALDDEDESLEGDDSSEDIQANDVYDDLAPKSPDNDDSCNIELAPPVIIPVDPVKIVSVNYKVDVDMRTLPLLSPNSTKASTQSTKTDNSQTRPPIVDPRVRRDLNPNVSNQSPNPFISNPDRTQRHALLATPTHITTPNSRAFEMTPTHQSFELEQSNRKHVYVPLLGSFDGREREKSMTKETRPWDKAESMERKSRIEDPRESGWHPQRDNVTHNSRFDKIGQRKDRYSLEKRDDLYSRTDCPMTPLPSFGRSDSRLEAPMTPIPSFGRGDCPTTPIHPFGRSDCPPTPTHPFGRLECPPTPSHHFGRLECPPTPNHPFGMTDCPPTPSHPFGRNEGPPPLLQIPVDCPSTPNPIFGRNERSSTPSHNFPQSDCPPGRNRQYLLDASQTSSHPFSRSDKHNYGRSDFSTQKYMKDPRLHRKPDYESNHYDERDRGYYNDRDRYSGSLYSSHQSYSGSDTYRSHDRNSKYKYFAPELSGRPFTKEDRNERFSHSRHYDDVASRRDYQRERSTGRNLRLDDTRSSARAPSVGRGSPMQSEDNLAKSYAGRSFTIDTSVNSTFQKIIDSANEMQGVLNSFDSRRQRAASVGRSLIRESSLGRTLPQSDKPKNINEKKRERFQRASSVGRESFGSNTDKRSFQEIKADFRSCKFDAKHFGTESTIHACNKTKEYIERVGRSRKDIYESQKTEKYGQGSSYSPRKNYRDPRMRKQMENKNDKNRSQASGRKSGIVYSNDNIVRGSILASGYGVKNYKIPKIKRVIEEKEDAPTIANDDVGNKVDEKGKEVVTNEKQSEKEDSSVKGNKKVKPKTSDTVKQKGPESITVIAEDIKNHCADNAKSDNTFKRQTRSSRKYIIDSKARIPVKTKKFNKLVYDSVSDDETEVDDMDTKEKESSSLILPSGDGNKESKDLVHANLKSKSKTAMSTSPLKDKNCTDKLVVADLDSSFGIDELEMFSDNTVTDTVIDNINSLIADLDNDLGAAKSDSGHNFTKEISLENMMQNISCPVKVDKMQVDEESGKISDATDDITNVKTKNANSLQPIEDQQIYSEDSLASSKTTNNEKFNEKQASHIDHSGSTPTQSDAILREDVATSVVSSKEKIFNEDIVSTTANESKETPVDEKNLINEPTAESCSTPDSTINTEDTTQPLITEAILPGNSNEVTSTESNEPKTLPSSKDLPSSLHSIGSLLSILQDKSKIKELLNMLGGESSDNEKIKKKLEKLSEIVSDDEESCDTSTVKTDDTETNDLTKDSVAVDIEKSSETIEKKELKNIESIQSNQTTVERNTGNDEGNNQSGKACKTTENKELENIESIETCQTKKTTVERTTGDDEGNNQLSNESDSIVFDDDSKIADDNSKASDLEADGQDSEMDIKDDENKRKKKPVRKSKSVRKTKVKAKKVLNTGKRVTRATKAQTTTKVKKPPRELVQLHEDIKDMLRDDVLGGTGLRMCRLAKLVDEKTSNVKEDREPDLSEVGPIVVLEKCKDTMDRTTKHEKVTRRKLGPKGKTKTLNDNELQSTNDEQFIPLKHKSGPKTKTKNKKEDPYAFECDSIDASERASDDESSNCSEFESDSLASSSFGSTELLADIKKKTKRKRGRGWKAGVIKPKSKKKKIEAKQNDTVPVTFDETLQEKPSIPDLHCFTDKNYCFRKYQNTYSCRLCVFSGNDIVLHYRTQHPHVEIPLSRMTPEVAREAIEQCEEINFKAISKIPSEKYVCTFCYKEFPNCKSVLETFFWHVVSSHTGEYKQNCSECVDMSECPFNLDTPIPPKDMRGQLIGYICKKCNFTQISLENLKTHVIVRHNDEQTAVYTINLSIMTKKALGMLLRRSLSERTPLLSSQITVDDKNIVTSDLQRDIERKKVKSFTMKSVIPPIQSKITFEGEDSVSEPSDLVSDSGESSIKLETVDSDNIDATPNIEEFESADVSEVDRTADVEDQIPSSQPDYSEQLPSAEPPTPSNDIVDYPHFKISITESGTKEYHCCINRDHHFTTTLLISIKKHVQTKHSEKWDGYCYVCKVIVTPQGAHSFKDCLQHYLDKHMDNFPVFEKEIETPTAQSPIVATEPANTPQQYISVRSIFELTRTAETCPEDNTNFPVIQNVMSLGLSSPDISRQSSIYPLMQQKDPREVILKYEEHQTKVISKKYGLVIQNMFTPEVLVKVFKCSGRYCSYATDSTEEALAHATTHQRVGGMDSLNCCYCDFDSAGNAVDLVTHIFKSHGASQYCCQKCFYRAMSSQAVGSHILRMHGIIPTPGSVLRTATVSPIYLANKPTLLSREHAVPYYTCAHNDLNGACKFRTFTPDKFCEHLQQRHAAAPVHPCDLCSLDVASAAELVQHMKVHGLKLYQCTWCVHGADNETEMLTHVASVHPDRQPQAYIRIITNKDGTQELRVLPLAFLNKHKVPSKSVISTPTKEHPVREAERSVEVETLISPLLSDVTITPVDTEAGIQSSEIPEEVIEAPPEIKPTVGIQIPVPATDILSSNNMSLVPPSVQCHISEVTVTAVKESPVLKPTAKLPTAQVHTPEVSVVKVPSVHKAAARVTSDDRPRSASPTVVTVTQVADRDTFDITTADQNNFQDVVVLVDSDEEENISRCDSDQTNESTIMATSSDNSTPTANTEKDKQPYKIVMMPNLYTCPTCKQICKNPGGLKKHAFTCMSDLNIVRCPHCDHVTPNLDKLLYHYVADHSTKNIFECSLCGAGLISENFARKHMKTIHKERNVVINQGEKAGRFIVSFKKDPPPKEREGLKRKLSGPKLDAPSTSTTPTKRRFEPQEIDQLPITPILDHLVYCSKCEFSTKVRLNMVRHLQQHAEQQPVAQTAPVNPVPHLETNEKHFDKMVNLASSSVVNRTPDKVRPEHSPAVNLLIPPEAASRYPKYVPERQRLTCGAKGCSYISVDEAMLRRHWEALHSGSTNFHCVHCPPHQHLDTSKPLTAVRILSHLKMHDATLYACSSCSYYHFKREALDKHFAEIHKTGRLIVVREEYSAPKSPTPTTSIAPTMDLKPWQCGLCKFKSMLRPEVVDHCFKMHQSKMQFKCAYCPFRTSAVENISKHQTNSHAGKPEEVFYYYYREGSIPDDADGSPRWVKQSQKAGPSVTHVKEEAAPVSPVPIDTPVSVPGAPLTLDLNIVKKEVETEEVASIDDLCKMFGKFCEPNGIKFKCPLCSVVMEDTRESMQSHLFEELNYRKWSCGLCAYKAFHKVGLTEHMTSEHRRQYDHIQLPPNANIERWVSAVLDHQVSVIDKHKENLIKQKIAVENVKPGPSNEIVVTKPTVARYRDKNLIAAFGSFGNPNYTTFCCPKCVFTTREEVAFRDHLEMELNKIRWCCNYCPSNFQTYHEAQFHCKGHDVSSRPVEAVRDPEMRANWVTTTIQKQKGAFQNLPTPSSEPVTPEKSYPESDNSLLIVRYTERVPTPEQTTLKRKRSIQDSDDEKLVIVEQSPKKKQCPYCDHSSQSNNNLKIHMLIHFNLRMYMCGYCQFYNYNKKNIIKHVENKHPEKPIKVKMTELPTDPEAIRQVVTDRSVCLVCEKSVLDTEKHTHLHNNVKPEFTKSYIVVLCSICLTLCADNNALREHHMKMHPSEVMNSTLYKLGFDYRKSYQCGHCNEVFTCMQQCKVHHIAKHMPLPIKMEVIPYVVLDSQVSESGCSSSGTVVSRKYARKSTTKLPNSVAKKSTTKLPHSEPSSSGYSYYGNKPPPIEQYSNVTTVMEFCNIMMPFSLKQLREHLQIEPRVLVTDINNQ